MNPLTWLRNRLARRLVILAAMLAVPVRRSGDSTVIIGSLIAFTLLFIAWGWIADVYVLPYFAVTAVSIEGLAIIGVGFFLVLILAAKVVFDQHRVMR